MADISINENDTSVIEELPMMLKEINISSQEIVFYF